MNDWGVWVLGQPVQNVEQLRAAHVMFSRLKAAAKRPMVPLSVAENARCIAVCRVAISNYQVFP